MPPKVKVSKEDIIAASLEVVRSCGAAALCARTIAAALGCSTQPLFSNFANMEELQQATVDAAYALYAARLSREAERGEYPAYKAYGMAYIAFAKEEKELFKLLFMRDRKGEPTATPDFNASVEMIVQANGITREQATRMHLEIWSCVHGIAAMCATGFLDLDNDLISRMLTDVYHGLRKQYTEE